MSFRTVFITEKSRCSYKNGYMMVCRGETTMIHLSEVSSILVENSATFFSTFLLAELAKAKIPVIICDEKHNPVGEYLPLYGAHNSSKKIREQIEWSEKTCKKLWSKIIESKIRNQAAVLQENGLAAMTMLTEYADSIEIGDKTNREGHAAKVYFNALFGKEFSRDQENATNAILNYGYSILLSYVSREIVNRGYLTQWGIFHRNEYNHFNLACDFMEPFRPVVDRFALLHEKEALSKELKVLIIQLFSEYYVFGDGRYRLQSILSLYVKNNLAVLAGRRNMSEYLRFDLHEE